MTVNIKVATDDTSELSPSIVKDAGTCPDVEPTVQNTVPSQIAPTPAALPSPNDEETYSWYSHSSSIDTSQTISKPEVRTENSTSLYRSLLTRYKRMKQTKGSKHFDTISTLKRLIISLEGLGREEEAEAWRVKCVALEP